MYHHVARSVPDRLLWHRDLDGLALFHTISRAFPEFVAVCVMPDHFHLILPHRDPDNRLHRVIAGYASRRTQRGGPRGPLWAARPAPTEIADEKHLRRTIRYVHMNPCRANLVTDPLAWPFSTHRDYVGFAARPVLLVADEPATFHRFVSADSTSDVAGTPMPTAPYESVPIEKLAETVASVWRLPVDTLERRHPARRTLVHAAVFLDVDATEVCDQLRITAAGRRFLAAGAVERGARVPDPVVYASVRAAGDPRFSAPTADDHRRERRWWRYAHRR